MKTKRKYLYLNNIFILIKWSVKMATITSSIGETVRATLNSVAITAYDKNCKEGNYAKAAQIAKEARLGSDKIRYAALKGFDTSFANGCYSGAAKIAKTFELGETLMH
jgi:hypothetical protein